MIMLMLNVLYKLSFIYILLSSFIFSDDLMTFVSDNEDSKIEIKNKNIDIPIFINELNSNSDAVIPSYSTFYQINDGYDINVSFTGTKKIVDSPQKDDLINAVINNSIQIPENNLIVSQSMIFRGIVIKQIMFYPLEFDFVNRQIYTYEDIELNIKEYEINESRIFNDNKLSKLFEPLYKDLIINYEPSSRESDYQEPSILYICGGASINNSYVQQLIDWRHKRGYVVNVVSTDDIGGPGSSAIKNYIQNAYEEWVNPPEIVGLIGDTSGSYAIGYFTESWSGYGGAGDFPYSQLDGGDLLPEVFIGRISVNSSSELNNVINKTLAYEKATYINQLGNDWYETTSLCADPSSSGQSTIIMNQYIENIMQVYDIENINTNYGNGNYSSWMENQLENGSLYMNYRGYIGVSGFTSSNINGANNGYKTPFVTFLTCGTGDFNYTSLSEEFFRAGSVNNPKGAVAAIGTATSGTHTMFNNIVSMGVYDGIFSKNLQSAGAVVANGRLALLHTYPDDPSNRVSIFSYWNNLIGDPGLILWTDTPKLIEADYENSITYGTNYIDIHVKDQFNVPVENALVTLLKGNDEIFMSGLSDFEGNITFNLDYESGGNVFLTITKQNCIPIEESFNIVIEDVNVNVLHENIQILDESGNGDGFANPGETVELIIPVINYGNSTAYNVYADLSSTSDFVNILTAENQYGNINPDNSSDGNLNYLLELSSQLVNDDDLSLKLNISNGLSNWDSIININLQAGMIIVDSVELIDNFVLNPGEQSEIKIFLENTGDIILNNVEINLLHSGYALDIIYDTGYFGDIYPGQIVESNVESNLAILVDQNTINGSILNINANIYSSNGYSKDVIFNINVGYPGVQDPLGPDEHGYYIYDSNDLDYNLAPIYNWIEIDQDQGGNGQLLNLSDGGDGNGISNSTITLDLPFSFKFYGINYNQLTINTNGWVTFGETSIKSFRNYPIPGAGGPSPMVAAFWDDLKTTSSAEIYKFDGGDHFIVEWSEMRTNNNNSIETFQIILYDESYLTPTGDNEIKIQYKEFNNTSTGSYGGWGTPIHGAYSTVGIENHLGTQGLQYTFNNEYPSSAMILQDESALFITTRNPIQTLLGDANQDEEINVLDVIVVVNHIMNVQSLDSMGAYIADLDGNGIINILDVIIIINLILES